MNRERYRLKSGNLAGGFGSISEFRDTYLERDVLYKCMQDPANNAQIENELRCLTKARSRHIVEIYDIERDQHGSLQGVVIEKLTGRDYSDFHRGAAQDREGYLRVVYQIACALTDLHTIGIVHRDLKLDNFKEASSGIVKLFDFGIASAADDYVTRQNRGTLVYAAPELYVTGCPTTTKLDIYALGVCCWKLLTNALPPALFERPPQTQQPMPSIDVAAPGMLPSDLVTLIDSCLLRDQNLRPHAYQLRDCCHAALLYNKHKGLLVSPSRARELYELSAASPRMKLAIGGLGEIRASYTGSEFILTEASGEVYVNNQPVTPGMKLHDACVFTFGDFSRGQLREYVTFFCSKPELIL